MFAVVDFPATTAVTVRDSHLTVGAGRRRFCATGLLRLGIGWGAANWSLAAQGDPPAAGDDDLIFGGVDFDVVFVEEVEEAG